MAPSRFRLGAIASERRDQGRAPTADADLGG
jgi:hypothetical protein